MFCKSGQSISLFKTNILKRLAVGRIGFKKKKQQQTNLSTHLCLSLQIWHEYFVPGCGIFHSGCFSMPQPPQNRTAYAFPFIWPPSRHRSRHQDLSILFNDHCDRDNSHISCSDCAFCQWSLFAYHNLGMQQCLEVYKVLGKFAKFS